MRQLIQNHALILPKIQLSQTLDWETLVASDDNVSVSVEQEVEQLWLNGPISTDLRDLDPALRCLTATWGRLLCQGRGKVKSFAKTGPADLVTAVDQGIEMLFRLWINRFLPDHKIIGEEGHKSLISPDDFVWYIDPVDGTTNFVEGDDQVSLLIGCLHRGKPFWATVALPFYDIYYSMSALTPGVFRWTSTTANSPVPHNTEWTQRYLGTEFMDSRVNEATIFSALSRHFGKPPLRVKSIGVNLSHFLTGDLMAFYKPKAKLWDVVAPLSLASALLGPKLQCEIRISTGEWFSLFSNHPTLMAHFNAVHRRSCNAGLILAYPSSHPELKTMVLDEITTVSSTLLS